MNRRDFLKTTAAATALAAFAVPAVAAPIPVDQWLDVAIDWGGVRDQGFASIHASNGDLLVTIPLQSPAFPGDQSGVALESGTATWMRHPVYGDLIIV